MYRLTREQNQTVNVLSRLFRRLFLEKLVALHPQLAFYGEIAHLSDRKVFRSYLAPAHQVDWVVYTKKPFSGPKVVLENLSR